MILKCPSCEAKYQIAEGAIGANGRNVRCAACGHYWFQKPDGIEEISILESKDKMVVKAEKHDKANAKTTGFSFSNKNNAPKLPHQKVRARAHNKIKMSQLAGIAAGWVLALCLMLAMTFWAVNNRVQIVQKWPKSASLFSALGVPVNLYGLEIKNVSLSMGQDTEGSRLLVRASIINSSKIAKTVPYLRVTLFDGNKKVLSWLIDPKVTVLEKGGKAEFEGMRRNPPIGNLRAELSFSEPPKDVSGHKIANQNIVPAGGDLLLSPSNETHLAGDANHAPAEEAAHATNEAHQSPVEHGHEAAKKDAHPTAVGR